MTDDQLSKLAAEDVQEFITKALYQHEPMLLASFMVIQGLGMFKSCLSPEDYNKFCKKVYDDRFRIKEYFIDDDL